MHWSETSSDRVAFVRMLRYRYWICASLSLRWGVQIKTKRVLSTIFNAELKKWNIYYFLKHMKQKQRNETVKYVTVERARTHKHTHAEKWLAYSMLMFILRMAFFVTDTMLYATAIIQLANTERYEYVTSTEREREIFNNTANSLTDCIHIQCIRSSF